jgi:RNA polymerase sigma factor (sigma-70 family)
MVPTDSDDRIPTRPDEQLLVVRCQLGEPEAFDALIDRWHGPLWVYIRRMTGRDDEAQDVLQDVWLRVVRGIARLRDAARLRAWLFGIARRVLMDRLRQKYAAPPIAEIEGCDVAAGPTPLDRDAELDALHAALERLPLVEREVLTLFYLRDLSLAELADALDVPVGTVKSRLFRARRLARTEMEMEGDPS